MKKYFGAVDIGGTKICVGIVCDDATILAKKSFPTITDENGGNQAIAEIIATLQSQCEENKLIFSELTGIGIVCAGPVNIQQGTVENPYTLPGWNGYPIVEILSQKTKLPVRLENDANGALMGELILRKAEQNRVLMITFGTGIGVAFWDSEKIYRCGNTTHPEMGHILVSLDGEHCYCGNRGCFEKQCSGTSLNERAQKLGFQDFDELYSLKNTDFEAASLIKVVKNEIKNGIWTLCAVFKPDLVILGGGLMKQYFEFAEETFSGIEKSKEDFVGNAKVVCANQTVDSSLVGTLMLF